MKKCHRSHPTVDRAQLIALLLTTLLALGVAPTRMLAGNKKANKADRPADKAATPTVTDAEIHAGIKKLTNRLFSMQNADGLWVDAFPKDDSIHGVQFGGTTALATLALLEAGVSYQDPRLERAIDFLSKVDMKGTYARSIRAQMWAVMPDRFAPQLAEDVKWLVDDRRPGPEGGYVFSYTQPGDGGKTGGGAYSNSRTKFAMLALWQGAKRGHPVPGDLWAGVEEHYTKTQLDDGGWGYNVKQWNHSRGSMTAAGLVSLHVIQDYLHAPEYRQVGKHLPIEEPINKGLAWFDRNYVPDHVPEVGGTKGGYSNVFYYLYAVERTGVASGVKYFNNKPWFDSGARVILDQIDDKALDPGRAINSKGPDANVGNQIISASFALMFLIRGGQPVLINKLEVPDYAWNNRPFDVKHLTQWVSDEMETPMLWQRVPITTPVDTWFDAPIMYLASHEPLDLNPTQKAKLKEYLMRGGLLVTSADSNSNAFNLSVKELMTELFPTLTYAKIAPDDPLYSAIYHIDPTFRAEALSNGVRQLAIHLPADVSWPLHARDLSHLPLWQFFANLSYVATEGAPVRGGVAHADGGKAERGDAVDVARVLYDGNRNAESLVWQTLGETDAKVDTNVADVELDKLAGANAPLAHLIVTDGITPTDDQANALRDYVKRGGTLLVEAGGGQSRFGEAAMMLVAQVFRDDRLRPISIGIPMITGEGFNGYDVTNVHYRRFTLLRQGAGVEAPRLMTVEIDGEPRVIVSLDDLSLACLGVRRWGVDGYATDSARRLLSNIARYAARSRKN
ncbi:MAG: DUF4159 domain-containing protein [Phycisphaera sp.]|nr:DUF4159 domain-containing protein [Phycisphaera sp.]